MLQQTKLNDINDSEIFRHYFGEFQLGPAYPSVFRRDENPSTGFYINKNDKLIYNDLTTGEKLGAVQFVMKLYNITYYEAVKKINHDIKTNYCDGKITRTHYEPLVKEEIEISIVPRALTGNDLAYFNAYNISQYELQKNNVYSVAAYFMKGKLFKVSERELKFAYMMFDVDKTYVKLYSPNSDRYKWISTIPLNKPFGVDTLPHKSSELVITKSLKDKIILNKFFSDVIALQNESAAAIEEELLLDIIKDYKKVYINFDADAPGKKASLYYEEKYGFTPLRVPEKTYKQHKIKDFSDFVCHYDLITLKKLFRWLNILS